MLRGEYFSSLIHFCIGLWAVTPMPVAAVTQRSPKQSQI
jgi:hypothetical protein